MSTYAAEAVYLLGLMPEKEQELACEVLRRMAWRYESEIPNTETLEAMQETDFLIAHPEHGEYYNSVEEMMEAILN